MPGRMGGITRFVRNYCWKLTATNSASRCSVKPPVSTLESCHEKSGGQSSIIHVEGVREY